MKRYVLTLVVIGMLSELIEGTDCNCTPKHPQTSLCHSDFVFFGKIVSITSGSTPTDPGETFYHIKILFVLKSKIGKPWHFVRIATPNDPQLCGVKGLALDSHLFSGQIASDGTKTILKCRDFVVRTSHITLQQWIYLLYGSTRGLYMNNCQCLIQTDSYRPLRHKGCRIPYKNQTQCYFKTALCYCTRKHYHYNKSYCRWSKNQCDK